MMGQDLDTLFSSVHVVSPATVPANTTCRTCRHRFRAQTDDHATKWEQYCELRKPKRKNTIGRLKVKVTDPACQGYEGHDI